jgi:hypothetical protein
MTILLKNIAQKRNFLDNFLSAFFPIQLPAPYGYFSQKITGKQGKSGKSLFQLMSLRVKHTTIREDVAHPLVKDL